MQPTRTNIAIRVYPEVRDFERNDRSRKPLKRPDTIFIFDMESRVDAPQRLTFGSYRFMESGKCLEEALIYGDDLPEKDREILERYASTHNMDVPGCNRPLHLFTRSQFVERLFLAAYKGHCLLCAFNFPFDISRVAFDSTSARGRFAGGFSLGLWSYLDSAGHEHANAFRPRIAVKQIDSKRALKGFTARHTPDDTDRIPEGSRTGKPEKGYIFRGHFLDLRTLAFALTDKSYTLESACKDFGVEHPKKRAERHGQVTEEYIDYNRRDVLATAELAGKLLEEYDKHPISLQVTKAYSPASIGKAYLREMGITPILERQPDFSKSHLGYAQSAFFGGRTSAHIRKMAVPVVYTDFLSMYPTVNSLMDLWRFVIAQRIEVIDHCQKEIEEFLANLKPEDLFKPANWKHLTAFVRIIPNGDILPFRAKFNAQTNDWQVAVNHLYAENDDPDDALWFSLADIVVSKLLTGRIPQIIDAFRIEAHGALPGLKPIKLRGTIEVDPRKQDFFRVVIEQRKLLASRSDLSALEKKRLDKALKVLANAASYGIYAEMNRQESDEKQHVMCHGIDAKPFSCRVAHPDVPGEYCFPPLASLITGAARLMLALLEHCVSDLGGAQAMEDTDSMAIVATEKGGMLRGDEGGNIPVLSWEQIKQQIVQKFEALNPYSREAIPGSVLKLEDDNFDPQTRGQRQLYCVAISAKRYVLFLRDPNGEPILLRKGMNNNDDRWSEHGLGHLLNPSDPQSEDCEWIARTWLNIVRKVLKLPTPQLPFENLPAVGRITISSPAVLRPLEKLNAGKRYPDQIKPSNFLLTCHVKALGQPPEVDAERFHLIAPYESNPQRWLTIEWIDQYSGKTYRISTEGHHGTRYAARVKTYGEVLNDYEYHPESKCADVRGNICQKQTIGLLQRRHIQIRRVTFIGKESNNLEEVQSGLIHSPQNVYTEYPDPKRDEWETKIRPAMKKVFLSVLEDETQLCRSTLIELRAGRSRPHPKNETIIRGGAKEVGYTLSRTGQFR
jgi:hypothetical protein